MKPTASRQNALSRPLAQHANAVLRAIRFEDLRHLRCRCAVTSFAGASSGDVNSACARFADVTMKLALLSGVSLETAFFPNAAFAGAFIRVDPRGSTLDEVDLRGVSIGSSKIDAQMDCGTQVAGRLATQRAARRKQGQ